MRPRGSAQSSTAGIEPQTHNPVRLFAPTSDLLAVTEPELAAVLRKAGVAKSFSVNLRRRVDRDGWYRDTLDARFLLESPADLWPSVRLLNERIDGSCQLREAHEV